MNPTTKKRSRVELQERDLDIFEAIYDLRFATVNHLAALFPSTEHKLINPNAEFKAGQKGIANRLSKLARQKIGHNYLKRIGYPFRLGTQPSVYTIEEKAARALADNRGYNLTELMNQIPYWIEPTTKDDQTITIIPSREDIPTINNRLIAKPNHKLHRTPDATLIIKPDKNQDHTIAYIYERDRGTETHARVATKLLCYFKWWQEEQHHQLFGTKHLKVLIETENEQRLKNMIQEAALKINHGKGSRIFWFTTTDHITLDNPENILEPIWIVGHQEEYNPDRPIKLQARCSLLDFTAKRA